MAFERITVEPDKLEARPCIRGLRITVETVVRTIGSAQRRRRGAGRGRRVCTSVYFSRPHHADLLVVLDGSERIRRREAHRRGMWNRTTPTMRAVEGRRATQS